MKNRGGCLKIVVWLGIAALVWTGFVFYAAYFVIDSPKREKVADCTSSNLTFALTVRHRPNYHFVIGMPRSSEPPSFRGEIRMLQGTGLVARIPISSDDLMQSTWLHSNPELTGYILTWSRTNRNERLGNILTRGQRYNVEVSFSQPPPTNSSLWFSSLGKVGRR